MSFSPHRCTTAFIATLLAFGSAAIGSVGFTPVDFSASHNWSLANQLGGASYPSGELTLGDVPFFIPSPGANNAWNSDSVGGPNPHVLEVPLKFQHATALHMLMNTWWGTGGPASYVQVECFGSGGAYFAMALVGNDNIRDYNQRSFTNSINGSTTINVFDNGGGQRMDKVFLGLPVEFCDQALTLIRVSDTGGSGFQRAWVGGITVEYVIDQPFGDLNCDGVVNGADLGILLSQWGPCAGCAADLNGDGTVNGADLGMLLGAWS